MDAGTPQRNTAGSRFTDEPLLQEAGWRGALAAAAAAEPARGPGAVPPAAPPRLSYGVSPPPITRLEGTPAGPGPLEGFGELPKKPGRGKSPPRVPGEERKLERAGAGLRFTLKFPV